MTSLAYVRRAEPSDAPAIANVVHTCWQERYAQAWPAAVWEMAGRDQLENAWGESLSARKPDAEAVVAIDDGRVVGFAAWKKTDHKDAELLIWEVAPDYRGRGHAARLLAALADIASDASVVELHWWASPQDEPRAAYLASTGWAADGARRAVMADSSDYVMDQRRWVTSLGA